MKHLEHIVACIKDKHVFIQTHNFPDPDAIASAYGLKVLLKQKGIAATICYKGRIDKTITAKMVKLLEIEIVEEEEITTMSEESEIILVDSQKGNANIINLPGDEILCIDHHPTYEKVAYRYADIRTEVGACSSIIASYFFENAITMDQQTATALLYGIKIDTANMTRGVSDLDLEMFYRIYHLADHTLIQTLDTSVLKVEDLRAYASAIDSIVNIDDICFANTGVNCPEALIASISDFILALDEIKVVVVYSLRNDGIKLSVRSSSSACNAGKVTNEALKGIGNGGGHEHMAGGFVPFPQKTNQKSFEAMVNTILQDIQKRFLECIEKQCR